MFIRLLTKYRERRARDAALIAAGICVKCKESPAEPGDKQCADCIDFALHMAAAP